MTKKKLKVLELFAGTGGISKAFRDLGHETYTIDWDEQHDVDWHVDIGTITAQDILERFGKPDIIWASFDCTTYSVAGISHHRKKEENGYLSPTSEKAEMYDTIHQNVLAIIEQLQPTYYYIENPRGGLRKMEWMQDLPRYTTTYCQYNDTRMKPTDFWTNHPNPKFKAPCKNGAPCHVAAPRGSQTGVQGSTCRVIKSMIPTELCQHFATISEEEYFSPEEFKYLHWQSDWNGDEVGYPYVNIVGLYSQDEHYYYIDMETLQILESWHEEYIE